VIYPIKLTFWSENCQEPFMVVESNHEGPLQCSIFPNSIGKGTFCNTVLFQSLVSSSNSWYLREGERNQMRVLVRSWERMLSGDRGQRPPELLWQNELNY
jgi:hypothetical protein